jgi:flagellar hook-basal body complex protein FliE
MSIEAINSVSVSGATGITAPPRPVAAAQVSFAELLSQKMEQAAQAQRDVSQAVDALAEPRNQDLAAVLGAMEKSDQAFRMLLAIRAKLMEAYEEIKNLQV